MSAYQPVKPKRGTKATIPATGLKTGELLITNDQGTAHVCTGTTTKIPVVPAIDDLTTIASVDGANDLLLMHDYSEASGQKAKKILFNDFKTALNIPAASSDEKAAVVSGGTAGYIWGTDGTDGIIRMGASMQWSKDSGNGFVTIEAGDIDGGTW